MDLRRVRKGEWIPGLAGLALLAITFMGWYGGAGEDKANAWEAFTVIDFVVALAALMALAYFLATLVSRTAAVPQALSALTVLAAGLAALLVLYRLIDLPDDGATLELGIFLGLVGTVVVGTGAWIGMRDESFPPALTPNLEVEVLPAPQPDGRQRTSP